MVSELRLKRLENVIRKKVGEMLVTELRDPRIGFLTITQVKLSRDLSHATILWSILGSDGDRSKADHALGDARGYIQSAVAKVMGTRVTPRLSFHYDPSIAKGAKVLTILRELREERGETDDVPAAEADPADETTADETTTDETTEDGSPDEPDEDASGADDSVADDLDTDTPGPDEEK